MGLIYRFAFGAIERIKLAKEERLPTLETLKSYLLANDFSKEARLVCYNDCRRCALLLDSNLTKEFKSPFSESPKLYIYDALLGFEIVDPDPYFDSQGIQKDLCFSYRINPQGVGDQIYVEYQGRIFDYTEYFKQVKIYDSLETIRSHKEELMHRVLL